MKHYLVFILVLGLTACATAPLTPAGARIEIATEARKAQCTSLGIVSDSEMWASSMGADAESAMNKVRNSVAAKGGNAMFIISTTSTHDGTGVTAEALQCPPK
jgi:hypothetical protein